MNNTKFKQTEIGEIPENWDVKKLKEIAIFINGYAFNSRSYVDSKNNAVPIFKMGNIKIGGGLKITGKEDYASIELVEKLKNYLTRKNDILMCMTDMKSSMNLLGHSAQIRDEKYFVNQRVGIIRPSLNINNNFLYYYLNSLKYIDMLRTTARSGVQVNLTTEAIKNSLVLYPPLSEQQEIASALSSLDDKIELNKKIIKNLEQTAQALFKHWFVDFEFPNDSGQPYKSSGGEMIDSELGEIPKGWSVEKISKYGDIICGKTPSKDIKDYFNGEIPFIKIPDMHDYIYIIKTEDSLTKKGADSQSKKFIPKNSICVSCIATVGLVSITSKDSQTNQQINSIVLRSEDYLEYLFFFLENHQEDLLNLASGGSATLNMNTSTFSNILVTKPSEQTINLFHKLINPFFNEILNYQKENITLASTRDLLLPKLLSGKIRV